MNAIYKVIWNDAIRQYQVVNELCRSRRKACSVKAVHGVKSRLAQVVTSVILGAGLAAALPASADEFDIQGLTLDFGTWSLNEPVQLQLTRDIGEGDTLVWDLTEVGNQVLMNSTDFYSQDSANPATLTIVRAEGGTIGGDVRFVIRDATGDHEGSYVLQRQDANLTYTVTGLALSQGRYALERVLTTIDLNSQQTTQYGQTISAGTEDGRADLSAQIIGTGNVNFTFSSQDPNEEGWLLLNGENANTYTGRTFVGDAGNNTGDKSVTIVYGKNSALGGILEDQRGTENLYVASNSEVLFAGESGTEQYSQYVHGLTGSGTLNLGSSAKLYLHQSGTGTGHISEIFDDDGDSLGSQIVISNVFAGSGVYDADTGSYSSSGAVFNVNLSGDVSGYEVVFTDNGSGYSGLINLTNSAVTAYDADRDVVIGGQTYTPNALLTSATVQLLDGGRLLVDGKGSAHNLIIDSENSAITFENLELGNGTLELDNLSLKNNGKIEIENITSDYQDEIDKKGFLEADEGITETLIHVSTSGSIAGGDRYGLSLGGSAVEGKQTTLSGGDVLANLYWNFDSDLIYSADDKTYSANYSLTKVDVQSGQFALEKTEDTGETATFTAEVSGAGGLLIDASGTTVYLGNTETGAPANSYEGVTTVTEGTNVVLAVDDAMGKTSSLEAKGNVTLENGVAQTIGGLTGSGTLTMESGSVLTLNQSGDVSLDNVLSGIGTFKVSGTGSNKSNVVFNGEFTYGGSLDFSNTVFDFDEGGNRSVASAADFNLSNSTLHLGESGGTFGNMTINDGVQFESAYLVIGSTTPSLSGSGTLNLNANTNITLEGISVADNIALINFDENTRYQDFITASGSIRGSGSVTLVPSPELTLTNYTYTGTYRQNGNIVANTTWTIAQGLQRDPASHSLQAGAVLTGIELTGGELVISGAGTLTAAITQRGGANASLTFRTSGTNPEAMTVLHSNNFTAGVGVDTGVTLTLAADSALGTTSGLTVASGAIVKLNDGISQTVGGLAGIGSVELGSGSEFTLRQDGDARIETAVSGGGSKATSRLISVVQAMR